MKTLLIRSLLAFSLLTSCPITHAGFDEGLAAYKKRNFATALKEWRPLAEQGNAVAQYSLGVMYDNGQGVPQDFKEAVRWYRLAADQGHAGAQNNLGAMFGQAHGVPHLPVLQHALYNLARAQGNEVAADNLKNLEPDLTPQEIADAQALAREMVREMAKPGGLIKALDAYVKAHPAGKSRKLSSAPPAGPYPAQPAKRPGVVSCNTNCNNGDCYRTYDSGRKVHFQAKHRYDALQGNWIWDAGSC